MKKIIPDEKCNMVILIWPSIYKEKPYWNKILTIFCKIIIILLEDKNHVLLVVGDADNGVEKEIENFYKKEACNITKNKESLLLLNKYLHLVKYNCNDIWVRDFGPQIAEFQRKNSFFFYEYSFNGYGNKYPHNRDKNFTRFFVREFKKKFMINIPLRSERPFGDLFIEGGNIQSNDQGAIIFNKRCVQKNNDEDWEAIKPVFENAITKDYIQKYLFLDLEPLNGDDTNGHLDNFVRLYDNSMLLYMSSNDINHPDFYLLKELKEQLRILKTKTSIIKELIAIEHTSEDILKNEQGNILPFSYLNFIVTNKTMIYPSIGKQKLNLKESFESIFHDKTVSYVNVEGLLNEFGGLHCCTLNLMY